MNSRPDLQPSAQDPGHAGFNAPRLDPKQVIELAKHSLLPGKDLLPHITQWESLGHDLPTIYLNGITEAARTLGQWWLSDEIDFATVTLGSHRLQRLLYDLSPRFLADASAPIGATVLVLAEPESQHTMGLFMLSQFFKRAGWYTLVEQPRLDSDVLRHLSGDWIDVLALSVSTHRQLDALRVLVRQARRLSHNPDMAVIAGGPLALSDPQALADLGVDWVGTDAASTVDQANLGLRAFNPVNQ